MVLLFLRFYHIGNGDGIAAWAVKTGRGPQECQRIIPIDIFPRPQAGELRALCIYQYAQLKKDPSACELLMPSSYGRSCLGETIASIAAPAVCNIIENGDIYCFDEKNQRYINPDCASLPTTSMVRDRCYGEYAEKNKDRSLCSHIANEKMRNGCEIYVKYAP
jgi:hypothetical protein